MSEENENIDPIDNSFEKLQKVLKSFEGNISILNEIIDINLQVEYFDASKKIKKEPKLENLIEESEKIFLEATSIDDKKNILLHLACSEDVKAYRLIERFVNDGDKELRHWAILAMNESKMHLQTQLLEKAQLFISTGLGGIGNKLRYFFALFTSDKNDFSEFQQKIMKTELTDVLKQYDSELEELNFHQNIATILVLIPVHISIQDLFSKVFTECNQYGNFLSENCIITNVRVLSIDDINGYISSMQKKDELLNTDEISSN